MTTGTRPRARSPPPRPPAGNSGCRCAATSDPDCSTANVAHGHGPRCAVRRTRPAGTHSTHPTRSRPPIPHTRH
ncbi:hypothetical protein CQY22_009875, partial [Mycolicibacterium brumae]